MSKTVLATPYHKPEERQVEGRENAPIRYAARDWCVEVGNYVPLGITTLGEPSRVLKLHIQPGAPYETQLASVRLS